MNNSRRLNTMLAEDSEEDDGMLSVEAMEERNRALREHVSQLEAMVGLNESCALVAALTHTNDYSSEGQYEY